MVIPNANACPSHFASVSCPQRTAGLMNKAWVPWLGTEGHSSLSSLTPLHSSNTRWLNGLQTYHDVPQLHVFIQTRSLYPNSSSTLTPLPQHLKLREVLSLSSYNFSARLCCFTFRTVPTSVHIPLPVQCGLPDGLGLLIFVFSAPIMGPVSTNIC